MSAQEIREIRINPIVPAESVLVATARSMRPKRPKSWRRGTHARMSTPARSVGVTRT